MNFSKRTHWDLSENEFTTAVRDARRGGREMFDLTVSNPTACGFEYEEDALLSPLAARDAMLYEPEPFGMYRAREAVSKYYADHGAPVSPANICLTTSTSEGYSFLFRLLCDPGDEVLVARPSYPLFEFIARLDGVRLREYPLVYDGTWQIDFQSLEQAITERIRAVVVVHPNNPTGNYVSEAERAALDDFCFRHGLALIADEVFLDYAMSCGRPMSFMSSQRRALTFVLSGVSKVCALPQMKSSWIAVQGPAGAARVALERLEVIADTFLSVNAPTQHALPHWLATREVLQKQIRARAAKNVTALDQRLMGSHCNRLTVEAGWTAVIRVPRHVDGVPFAEAAIARGVVVQPGEFYGLSEGHIVISLLTPPEIWKRGLASLPIN